MLASLNSTDRDARSPRTWSRPRASFTAIHGNSDEHLSFAILLTQPLFAADPISSAQAKDHIGETKTVCGRIADARYLETRSYVTFLNFDKQSEPAHANVNSVPLSVPHILPFRETSMSYSSSSSTGT